MYYVITRSTTGRIYKLVPGNNPMGKDEIVDARTGRDVIAYDTMEDALQGIATALFPVEDGETVEMFEIRIRKTP